jgi:adenosylmethionine-8-amino-7-oxononanoate aminotransferase
MVADKAGNTPFPWQQRRGLGVYRRALEKGALLRPLGNVVYFMPPLTIREGELARLLDIAWEAIVEETGV